MKKILGQNFLINDSISKKIVEFANFCQDDEIIEIGPGNGSLTDHLLNHHNKLTLLEIDLNLIKKLKTKYRNYNLKIINEDARFFQNTGDREYSIIGNLPYYASNKIIRNFLHQKNIKKMIFTIQKEVGEQIKKMRPGPATGKTHNLSIDFVPFFFATIHILYFFDLQYAYNIFHFHPMDLNYYSRHLLKL